jgi:hypothetical protein
MQPPAHIVSFYFPNNILQNAYRHALVRPEKNSFSDEHLRESFLAGSPIIVIQGENGGKSL